MDRSFPMFNKVWSKIFICSSSQMFLNNDVVDVQPDLLSNHKIIKMTIIVSFSAISKMKIHHLWRVIFETIKECDMWHSAKTYNCHICQMVALFTFWGLFRTFFRLKMHRLYSIVYTVNYKVIEVMSSV